MPQQLQSKSNGMNRGPSGIKRICEKPAKGRKGSSKRCRSERCRFKVLETEGVPKDKALGISVRKCSGCLKSIVHRAKQAESGHSGVV